MSSVENVQPDHHTSANIPRGYTPDAGGSGGAHYCLCMDGFMSAFECFIPVMDRSPCAFDAQAM